MSVKKDNNGLYLAIGLIVGMFALSFISVPLYRIFCQKTGYGGTPRIATAPTGQIMDREITIDFFAATHKNLMCEFTPLQKSMRIKVGELALAFYKVKNTMQNSALAIAAYNVTPDKVGQYFMKVECFCFDDRVLEPGVEVLPVQFYIHPDFAKNPDMADVENISLFYTFFPKKDFDFAQYIRGSNLKPIHVKSKK